MNAGHSRSLAVRRVPHLLNRLARDVRKIPERQQDERSQAQQQHCGCIHCRIPPMCYAQASAGSCGLLLPTRWGTHKEMGLNSPDRPSSVKLLFMRQAWLPAMWKEINPRRIKRKPALKIKQKSIPLEKYDSRSMERPKSNRPGIRYGSIRCTLVYN